jgi:hypothetical protein
VKFVDMLSETVALCHKPPLLHEKLAELSPMHIQHGVEAKHMSSMGKVLFSVLEKSLRDKLTTEVRLEKKHLCNYDCVHVCMRMCVYAYACVRAYVYLHVSSIM